MTSLLILLLAPFWLCAAETKGPKTGPQDLPGLVNAPGALPALPALPALSVPGQALPAAPQGVALPAQPENAAHGPEPAAARREQAPAGPVFIEVQTGAGKSRAIEGLLQALFGGESEGEGRVMVFHVGGGEDPRLALDAFYGEGSHRSALSEEERLFADANPGSRAPAVLASLGIPFEKAAADMLLEDSFRGDRAAFLSELHPHLRAPVGEILGFSDRAAADEQARAFARLVGRNLARRDTLEEWRMHRAMRHMGEDPRRHKLPANPLGEGEYWDLASGINTAGLIMNGIDRTSQYRFFDVSHFVTAFLQESVDILRANGAGPLDNVSIEQKDIWTLQKPARPLAALRAKNVTYYVPGFERKLDEMADWIAPGGRFYLPSDMGSGQQATLAKHLGATASRLLMAGWGFDYQDAPRGGLDLASFERPYGRVAPPTQKGADSRWEAYKKRYKRFGWSPW